MKMTIGQRIKNRRIELNLSVDEVAEKLNKNRATIYRYEKDDIKELPITVLEPLAKVLETTPADLMGWEKFDSRFSGKEASPEIYDKFKNNIMKFHGKQKELLSIYEDLSEKNKDKVLQYSKNLLSNQQMEEDLMPNAAHERTTPYTAEERQDDESMLD